MVLAFVRCKIVIMVKISVKNLKCCREFLDVAENIPFIPGPEPVVVKMVFCGSAKKGSITFQSLQPWQKQRIKTHLKAVGEVA